VDSVLVQALQARVAQPVLVGQSFLKLLSCYWWLLQVLLVMLMLTLSLTRPSWVWQLQSWQILLLKLTLKMGEKVLDKIQLTGQLGGLKLSAQDVLQLVVHLHDCLLDAQVLPQQLPDMWLLPLQQKPHRHLFQSAVDQRGQVFSARHVRPASGVVCEE
jgi:hypothetical protein